MVQPVASVRLPAGMGVAWHPWREDLNSVTFGSVLAFCAKYILFPSAF